VILRQAAGTPRRMRQLHETTDQMRQMTGACVTLPETGQPVRRRPAMIDYPPEV
jgi:hypothetical protein